MSTPFIGEIKMFGGNFAIRGFAFCQGQLLSIAQNTALFSLIGTTYGGDGQTSFGLPDLRGRLPIGQGQSPGLSSRTVGELGGTETVTLLANQAASHTHPLACSTSAGNSTVPTANFWAANANVGSAQFAAASNTSMNGAAMLATGGNLPHENMMPYLGINFIIALEGIFPSRN